MAQQSATEQLSIRPAPGSSTDPAGSYFVIASKAGRTVRQSLEISSKYNEPIALRLSTVDAATANKGGLSFELPDAPVDDEGAWIEIEKGRLRLAPGATTEIPFRVRVPSDTEPGVHLAGLAVELLEEEDQPDESPTSGGAVIDVKSRFVVAVQVDLPGDSTPELVISGVEPVVRTGGVTLEVLIENVGFGLAKGEGVLELPDEGFEEPLPLGTFVPGTSIRYPVTWERDPAEGEYRARVELNYSEGDPELLTGRASWEGTFLIGEAQTGELARLQGSEPFNWLLVIVPAALLLLLSGYLVWRRRRVAPAGPSVAPQQRAPQAPAPRTEPPRGYTGSADGTFGGASRSQQPPPAKRPPGVPPPPPPPPPPKQEP